MKVLFDHADPFLLAHGGFQIQIEQTRAALEGIGLAVDWLRWWDDRQQPDLIHYFGRPHPGYVELAHRKGIRVVFNELLTGLGSRGAGHRMLQRTFITGARKLLPAAFTARMAWDTYQHADGIIALTEWEAQLMREMFNAPAGRVHVVPNGVEREFFEAPPAERGDWLVCTATITERKRPLELAEAAVAAGVPVWIIGKPYSESDPYAQRFLALAKRHPEFVRYEGGINGRAKLAEAYRAARGFVLLSTMESLSLSALEAAATGTPLLLSDLPWARSTFHEQASYCPIASTALTATHLKTFHARAASLPLPSPPRTWKEIAGQLAALYERVLSTSR